VNDFSFFDEPLISLVSDVVTFTSEIYFGHDVVGEHIQVENVVFDVFYEQKHVSSSDRDDLDLVSLCSFYQVSDHELVQLELKLLF
jgi:hypothetical protein